MKKIKLNLSQLKVDSFEVSKTNSTVGTVHGNGFTEFPCKTEDPRDTDCIPETMQNKPSCLFPCDASIRHTNCCWEE